jgi:hypothetical protein
MMNGASGLNGATGAMLIASVLIVSSVIVVVPDAAAHSCTSETDPNCDPNGCKDGEDHDHTKRNKWPKRDESCTSEAEKPVEMGCSYNGVSFPEVACRVLEPERGLLGTPVSMV